MARGSKYSDSIRERALCLLATTASVAEVAKILDLPKTTVNTWKKSAEENDADYNEHRAKRKRQFVDKAWSIANKATDLINQRITRAGENEKEIDKLIDIVRLDEDLTEEGKKDIIKQLRRIKCADLGELVRVVGTMYDKQELASQSIENTTAGAFEVAFESVDKELSE